MRIGSVLGVGALVWGSALGLGCSTDEEPERVWPAVQVDPAPATLKRLTEAQYENSIHDLVGETIAVPISLEPDADHAGFLVVGGSISSISALGTERYESAAYNIAEQAMDDPAIIERIVPCTPGGVDDAGCAAEFVTAFGRRAFRRPVTDAERDRYVAAAMEASAKLGDFYDGLEFAMAGLLMSPHFLFRVELGQDVGGRHTYGPYEMASRLAFFLWNTTPDDALLEAAERGELTDADSLTAQVDRMLADPRAREGVRNFFMERFHLHELDDLVKDSTLYTEMSADLGPDAREETLRVVEELVFDRDADYRVLFTSRWTHLNRRLASLYGVPAPALEGFAGTFLPEDGPRAGLLGHASILMLHAHPTATSATLRGLFVREALLCGEIPPPPADVDTSLPEATESFPTLRDRIDQHLSDPTCAGCHLIIDPIGLGLEQFDGLAKFRATENGEAIDASGELDGTAFTDALSLGEAVARHHNVGPCLVRHLYRYATGVEETEGDEAQIAQLSEQFAHDGFKVKSLLRRVALSDGFRFGKAGQ